MAIKITTDKIVRIIRPHAKNFNLDELNQQVDDFINPFKVGPIWVMTGESSRESGAELNEIASFFFDLPLYGDVIVVPPQQLPPAWDIMEETDYKYTAEELDSGFLLSLQTSLVYNRVLGGKSKYTAKEEWTFTPPENDNIDEGVHDFYRKVYDYIIENPDMFNKNYILEDESVIVKVRKNGDRNTVLQQMMEYFICEEEYEKCAQLKKVIEE
jgi:hypothetical protein